MADNGVLPRFFKVFLLESCSESLMIPLPFNGYLRDPLLKSAKLQACGGKVWKVKIRKTQAYIYFTHGWRLFAEENDLKDGEFLTFVYDGIHTFEVSIYNRWGCKETRGLINLDEDTMDDDDYSVYSQTETNNAGANSAMGDLPIPNPCFETKIKTRKYELLVPSNVVKDYRLRFGSCINYIDEVGTLQGTRGNWKDQRICFKGWDRICRRNMLKDKDTVRCEILHTLNLVHSIKISIIRGCT